MTSRFLANRGTISRLKLQMASIINPFAGSPAHPQFRLEPALMYVDESGLLQKPLGAEPSDIGTLGALIIPDHEIHRAALHDLLKQVRTEMFGDPLSKADIKAKKLGDKNYNLIADTIRRQWVLGHHSLPYTAPDLEKLKSMLGEFTKQGGLGREKLSGLKGMDLRVDFLERQLTMPIFKPPTGVEASDRVVRNLLAALR